MDNSSIVTIIVQIIALVGTIYAANKDNGSNKKNMDVMSQNSMLKMDIKRICDAVFDDVPYEKLKDIAKDIEDNYRN